MSWIVTAMAGGCLHATVWEERRVRDCRFALTDGEALTLSGVVESAPQRGRFALRVTGGMRGCHESVRVLVPKEMARDPSALAETDPGSHVTVTGAWRRLSSRSTSPEFAGEVVARRVEAAARPPHSAPLLRRRGHLEERLERLYPERHGVVSALILARNEALSPELKASFARAGTAHLLAISGFHVGVVAAILLGVARAVGFAARPAGVLAAAAVWAYVLFIGAPDAAARSALIVSLFTLGALQGRPLSRPGALATAFIVLILWDAGALARPGFQLSFCGVLGLVLLASPIEGRLRVLCPWAWARSFRSALAASIAATLFTTPAVAWHFDQVSLVGIPATLIGTPFVAAAIPGAFASLVGDALHPSLGGFIAGGTDLLLWLLLTSTEALAALPYAVAPIPREWIFAGAVGGVASLVMLSESTRVRGGVRGTVALAGAAVAVLLLPVGGWLSARGTLELHFLNVGQGDAILIRSPRSRWALVDAGPPGGSRSRGDPAVLAELRRRGVRRLEALLLTHPHLDHIGGAPAVLAALPVGVVVDPGLAMGTDAFIDALEGAAAEGSGWRAAREGDLYALDGAELRVLNSLEEERPTTQGGDVVNENSLVVLLTFGGFSALLTGDAPIEVEEGAVAGVGAADVLKVGHHGSRTSTSGELLEQINPGVAVISVGRGNRYGHPHEPVLARLEAAGVDLYRTDRHGTVSVKARRDGSYRVRAERKP